MPDRSRCRRSNRAGVAHGLQLDQVVAGLLMPGKPSEGMATEMAERILKIGSSLGSSSVPGLVFSPFPCSSPSPVEEYYTVVLVPGKGL